MKLSGCLRLPICICSLHIDCFEAFERLRFSFHKFLLSLSLMQSHANSLHPFNFREASVTQHQLRTYHCEQHVLQNLGSVQKHIRKTRRRLQSHAVQAEVIGHGCHWACLQTLGMHEATFCMQALPIWMPPQIKEIQDPAALAMAARMQRTTIQVPGIGPVDTVFVGPGAMHTCAALQLGNHFLLLNSMIFQSSRPCMLCPTDRAACRTVLGRLLSACKTALHGVWCCN